ncbi:ribbon-helix-helix protein, CopG family [Miniimonas arenae]|uniref:ribbon-helix-helix protein, CopG family n=2 Tax=Miniimonas TaxID=947525 RepID=UPI0028ADA3F4|nr:ribbon-helix-helix protein, CopG family [Miniimonas arenae]
MTLRLDDDQQEALDRIATAEGITSAEAVRRAILEYDAKRRSVRDALIARIVEEDRPLLDRLG